MCRLLWVIACVAIPLTAQAQQPKPKATVGAYYFDGWSGQGDHISKLLETKYADRKPLWGWKDDTVEIMQKQIDYCADHGIAFWAFDWYYPEGENKTTPLNNALDFYLKAPNRQRLRFCLLVANHSGFRIGPKDWDACCQRWIELFKQPTHLQTGGQPLLIFFAPGELKQAFGGVEGVRQAFESLRAKAKAAGLRGVSIAACTGPEGNLDDFVRSGYTLLTGYNYPLGWLNGGKEEPFRKLIEGSERIFDQFAEKTPLPYVPVITAGRDRRPWEEDTQPPDKMLPWVSRPHAQGGRGLCEAGHPLAGQASRQDHTRTASVDLCMERKRRRRFPDADCRRRNQVSGSGAAGNRRRSVSPPPNIIASPPPPTFSSTPPRLPTGDRVRQQSAPD